MYPIPPTEKLVQTKTCRHCGVSFSITDKDLEFYEKVSLVFGGKKYLIPTPTLCPDCRQQRRLSFRNERKLYKRKCDATGRDIISIYSPNKPFKVYHQDFWWSDKWDAMSYGRDFDFSRPFFEQFGEIKSQVPRLPLFNINGENSEYLNHAKNNKNCYMSIPCFDSEDVHYSFESIHCTSCIDNYFCTDCQECYESIYCNKCFNLNFAINCKDSSQGIFLNNCNGCSYCFMCTNLTNKQYYFKNKPLSKDEYLTQVKLSLEKGISVCKNEFRHLLRTSIHGIGYLAECSNCIGDCMVRCTNCVDSYELNDVENVKYSVLGSFTNQAYDAYAYGLVGTEKLYEVHAAIGQNLLFSNIIYTVSNLIYCDQCYNITNCFGCVGLSNNKSYCIFNKQYTKEEYETLVPKIIEHMMKTKEWGEFFPSSLSPFGYNETVAQEYYPLTKEQAIKNNIFNWSDYEPPFPKVEKIIPADKLPDDITKIPDDILNWAIECEVTKKPFRIIKQELEFYRKHNLPIPRRHPDQRHLDRIALRNPRNLFERKCDKCGKEIITTYSPERKEIVYCEKCYNKEVVG